MTPVETSGGPPPPYAWKRAGARAQLARSPPDGRRHRAGRGAARLLAQHAHEPGVRRRRRGRGLLGAADRAAGPAPARAGRGLRARDAGLRRRAAARRRVHRRERRARWWRSTRWWPTRRGGWPRSASPSRWPGRVPFAALLRQPLLDRRVRHLAGPGRPARARRGARRPHARAPPGARRRSRSARGCWPPSATSRPTIAAAAERARIARELHDVVAHSLSVVIAQADGGRYAAEQDPSAATAALHTIAATAREAQAEMRRALGILREQPGAPLQPQPGVDELAALVARTREAGLAVELTEEGPRAAARAGRRRDALPRRPGGAHQRAQARGARGRGERHAALGARPGHARRARRRRRRRAPPTTAAAAGSSGCASASSRAAARSAPARIRTAGSRSAPRSPPPVPAAATRS